MQDQDKPTAAERQKHVDQNGVAPHQASQLHHVIEERHSEEQALSDAWNIADSLTEEPGAIEEAQANGEQPNRSNGAGEEGAEHGEGEAETEDDMMDRISSSPSIDDGGYTLHSSPPSSAPCTVRLMVWPARSSSLSPTQTITPTRAGFNSSATSSLDSSPFVQTPQHLPLRCVWPQKEASPLSNAMD